MTLQSIPGPSRSRLSRRAFLPVLSLVMAALLLLSGCGLDASESEAARPHHPLLVVGVDGATFRVLEPLVERGEMPHLASLMERGVSGELATLRPAKSPVIWTSIATGCTPEQHSIRGFWYTMTPDEIEEIGSQDEQDYLERLEALGYIGKTKKGGARTRALYHSGKRKAPAIWNRLTDAGLSCDVLGWWTTYPVEEINGRMVSDRYVYSRFELASEVRRRPYDTSGRQVHPPELARRYQELITGVDEVTVEQLQRFIDGPVRLADRLTLHGAEDELRITLAKDLSFEAIALDALRDRVPDAHLVYLQGVDIASHYFWKYRFPEEWAEMFPNAPIPPEEQARYGRVVDEYYRFFDEQLGRLVAAAGPEANVLVLSDHGFETGRRGADMLGAAQTVSGVHGDGPPGVLVMAGPDIASGARLAEAHIYDVYPTMMRLVGLTADPGIPGRVLEEALASSEGVRD